MKIFAIETSCDETAASVLEIKGNNFSILSNIVSSQVKTHAKYGGVVPEVAARKHAENIMPVILESLKFIKNPQKEIDTIAVTQGPGLITSLRVGSEAAKTLAYVWKKPLIAVNHVIAHIYANWLAPKFKIEFPALCLVVSGGHTLLILMKNHGNFEIVGQTLDDAAGECFDKTAKILGLGYPGGPAIARRAEQLSTNNYQLTTKLPRPMLNSNDFDFSFSGLKTAVLYKAMKQKKLTSDFITQMAYETQNAIVDVLVSKTIRAAKKYNVKTIMLGGGVAANYELRKRFQKEIKNLNLSIPDISLCTDNAAMIAVAAYFNPKKIKWDKIEPDPNLVI
jgi:N6-L-threonylcarbamoyladenine synthase